MSANPGADFQPEIVVLYCRQTLAAEERPGEGRRQGAGFHARLAMLPCSSKMEGHQLLRIVEQGADGVLVVACPEKACRFLVGNDRAGRRVERARGLLSQVGMGQERLALVRAADQTINDLIALAGRRAAQVKDLGPNPMKGADRQ